MRHLGIEPQRISIELRNAAFDGAAAKPDVVAARRNIGVAARRNALNRPAQSVLAITVLGRGDIIGR